MPAFYDTHAHLDYPVFAPDLSQVIQRATTAGITRIIAIGTDLASSLRAILMTEQFPEVFAAVGWHPCEALTAPSDLAPRLRELAGHPKVVAIGETGLDFHHLPSQRPGFALADDDHYRRRQLEIFRQQLELAAEFQLNCIVHQRDALDAVLQIMTPFAGRPAGVFHCFADDALALQRVLAIGSIVSFTGIVTFKNAQKVRDALTSVPLDRFMLETDCPFLAPVPYRGKRCEPAYVATIADVASAVKGCSLELLSEKTCATAHRFFPKLR